MSELDAAQKRHFLVSQLENYMTQRYRNVVETQIVTNAAETIGEDYKTKKELDEITKQMDWKNEELDVAIATLDGMIAELPEVVEE